MTTYYVDSAGSNTSPYDTLAKAATDYATVHALLVSGDIVLIRSNYDKDYTGNTSLTWPGDSDSPCILISIDASENYEAGAEIGTATGDSGDLTFVGNSFISYGVTWTFGDDFFFGGAENDAVFFRIVGGGLKQDYSSAGGTHSISANTDRSHMSLLHIKGCDNRANI